MNYFVYILYSEGFQKYYVGQTQELQERLVRLDYSFLSTLLAPEDLIFTVGAPL